MSLVRKYWLMKSEPEMFSIDDLRNSPKQTAPWDGVRNYQARNMLRDQIKKGDLVLFYHSSCKPPGIAGIAEVVTESYPDETAFTPASIYYDPKSKRENPRWFVVDVKFKEKFPELLTLEKLRKIPELENMILFRKGNRLSVMPITKREWDIILGISHTKIK